MGFYFYCPGEVVANASTVQCSETLQAYEPPFDGDPVVLSELIGQGIYWGLTYWALFFIFGQIKKAIEGN